MRVLENAAASAASAGAGADPFTPEIRNYIKHLMERFHVPSLSIGIIQNGQTHLKVHFLSPLSSSPNANNTRSHSVMRSWVRTKPRLTHSTTLPR